MASGPRMTNRVGHLLTLVAGLLAGLSASRGHLGPRDATPNTSRTSMKPYIAIRRYLDGHDLLIRRSWVRNPPGSYTYLAVRSRLAGLLAGRRAEIHTDRRTVDVEQLLRVRRIERDRELLLINLALRSGTTRLLG